MTPLAKPVDVTMPLTRVALTSNVSVDKARSFMRAIAVVPMEDGDSFIRFVTQLSLMPARDRDAVLAEARRDLVRELSAELRSQRSRK